MAPMVSFKKSDYILLVASIAALVFLALTLSSNIGILKSVLPDGTIPLLVKVNIVANIPYGYLSEPSPQSLTAMLISLLFGINLAGIVHYVRLYRATALSVIAALGSGSTISAIVGAGCISCGSLAVAFLASLFGASSLAIALPLDGLEFSFVSIALLLISIFLVNKKIRHADRNITNW